MVFSEESEVRPGGELGIKPFLQVDGLDHKAEEFFAALAKELSRLGFRDDSEEKQLADVLKAKEEHLQDMRKLIFDWMVKKVGDGQDLG
jgi:hypothetical protein